jgi:hypothetical protein
VVDIYRLGRASQVSALRAAGITCLTESPPQEFDLAVIPVHAPASYLGEARPRRTITHHEAVGELASFPVPVVEVTGTKAKTSTCFLLADMLARADPPCLLLCSAGLMHVGPSREVLVAEVSITPASILRASRMLDGFRSGVFEVSLGGSGLADVSIVTSMDGEYRIAAGTRTSFEAKSRMVRTAKKAVAFPKAEEERWNSLVPAGAKVAKFGPGGDVDLILKGVPALGEDAPACIEAGGKRCPVSLSGSYLHASYQTAFQAAAAGAWLMNVPLQTIAASMTSFRGVQGRGELRRAGKSWLVTDRNPGISAASIAWQVKAVESQGARDIAVLIDPVNRKVCEKLDLKGISAALRPFRTIGEIAVMEYAKDDLPPGMGRAAGPQELLDRHQVVLHFIKEGFQ